MFKHRELRRQGSAISDRSGRQLPGQVSREEDAPAVQTTSVHAQRKHGV